MLTRIDDWKSQVDENQNYYIILGQKKVSFWHKQGNKSSAKLAILLVLVFPCLGQNRHAEYLDLSGTSVLQKYCLFIIEDWHNSAVNSKLSKPVAFVNSHTCHPCACSHWYHKQCVGGTANSIHSCMQKRVNRKSCSASITCELNLCEKHVLWVSIHRFLLTSQSQNDNTTVSIATNGMTSKCRKMSLDQKEYTLEITRIVVKPCQPVNSWTQNSVLT